MAGGHHHHHEAHEGRLRLYRTPVHENHLPVTPKPEHPIDDVERTAPDGRLIFGEAHENPDTTRSRSAAGESSASEHGMTKIVPKKEQTRHPVFRRYSEATPIELFYDLFFVANLAAFTTTHRINDTDSLSAYVGFFCIMWFTWLQVALYDVRLSRDSVLERTCKAIQFGVMCGFAVSGTSFNPRNGVVEGQKFSLTLMASRITLAVQYLLQAFSLRAYSGTKPPLMISGCLYAAAAAAYLGVSFAFPKSNPSMYHAYIAWYVIAGIETMVNIGVSSVWKAVSFKDTHIVQRLSLLTLIILGEGVLALCKSIQTVEKNNVYSPAGIGAIISDVLILYSTYMLYFDTMPEEHFGTIRQHLWAALHFPFHVSLVLFVEGASKAVVWLRGVETVNSLTFEALTASDLSGRAMRWLIFREGTATTYLGSANNNTQYFATNVEQLRAFAASQFKQFPNPEGEGSLMGMFRLIRNGTARTPEDVAGAVLSIHLSLFDAALTAYTIYPPALPTTTLVEKTEKFKSFITLFDLIYVYLFGFGGLVVFLIGCMYFLFLTPKKGEGVADYIRGGVFLAIGVCIALLSLMTFTIRRLEDPGLSFITSAWLLPTILFLLLICVAVYHLPLERIGEKRKSVEKDDGNAHSD